MTTTKQAIASTARLVAAIRAEESQRPDRLFTDPLAARLAGSEGSRLLSAAQAAAGDTPTVPIVIRTKFWDDTLLAAQVPQVVILAAGMDTRAYRLPWPTDTTLYEVDQPHVMASKDDLLANESARCRRVSLGVDLSEDWPETLRRNGFRSDTKTAWLVEGLLQYIDADAVDLLFDRITAQSAPGSILCFDVVGRALLTSPSTAAMLESMKTLGAPWIFGTDEPASLIQHRGWAATVTDLFEPGSRWNRSPAPITDAGAPRGYLVLGRRR